MPLISSFIAAIFPMLFYLIILWRMDKYDSEPLLFVFVHFLWGAFGAIIFGISGSLLLAYLTGIIGSTSELSKLIQTIIFAPLSEEIAKGAFLLYTVNSKKFDNITDGLLYGGVIGLGFGMTENFLYFLTYGDTPINWIYLVVIRSLFSALMHCISTGTFGAFLALAKFSSKFGKNILPLVGLLTAIFIHFMWNTSISFSDTYLYGFLFMIFIILFFIFIFRLSVNNEKKIIERELLEESLLGLIPKEHIKILSSHLRFRKGWIDERIRKLYSRFAIRLALNKDLFRKAKDLNKLYYSSEIEKNREAIRSLLSNNFIPV